MDTRLGLIVPRNKRKRSFEILRCHSVLTQKQFFSEKSQKSTLEPTANLKWRCLTIAVILRVSESFLDLNQLVQELKKAKNVVFGTFLILISL